MTVGCVFQASGMTGFGWPFGRHCWEIGRWEEGRSRGISPFRPWVKIQQWLISSMCLAPLQLHHGFMLHPGTLLLAGNATPASVSQV